MVAGIRNYLHGALQKKKKNLGLITIGLLQLQLSVISQPCIILLLTFVAYKSHYSYGNTSTNV